MIKYAQNLKHAPFLILFSYQIPVVSFDIRYLWRILRSETFFFFFWNIS